MKKGKCRQRKQKLQYNSKNIVMHVVLFFFQQRRRNLDLKFGVDWFHDNYVANTGFLIQYATSKISTVILISSTRQIIIHPLQQTCSLLN